MELCFGTYANTLKLCCRNGVYNKTLVDALVKTIDPDSKYLENDASVSRLLNCTANFPETAVSENHGPIKALDGPITRVIALARHTNVAELSMTFDDAILPLLDPDQIIPALCTLQTIIQHDYSLLSRHSKEFEACMGYTPDYATQMSAISPASFLAGLFLYTVLTNENKGHEEDIKLIDAAYISRAAKQKAIRLLDCPRPDNLGLDDNTAIYLHKILHTYDKIKTLLYSEAPVPFYDFYVCNNLYRTIPNYHNKRTYQRITITDATMEKLARISSYIILSGTGGLGKSMMMRHLLLDAASRYQDTKTIPLFIQLKNYRKTFPDLVDFLLFEVSSLWPGISREGFVSILKAGNALLLFDGLDEIGVDTAADFQQSLDTFINLYTENLYIISSRPYGNFSSYTRFTVLNLDSFSKSQSLELIDKLDFRPDMPEIKAKFRTELEHHLYWSHHGFSDNPLLLTIMLMTFEEFAEVPSKMHIFYQEAYTVLSKKHDASKGGFRRALKTGITTDQFANMFARFCGITYKDEKFEFSWPEMDRYFRDLQKRFPVENKATDDFIFDACSNLCVMYLDGGRYSFIHRSFQEYFCARYFARQKDRNLEQIGKLFEHNRLARQSDQTFQMLYDMIPEKVIEFIIIPFLRNLLEKCDNENGYHTFLREVYGSVEMGDEYVIDKGNCFPSSTIYHFILHQFSVQHPSEIDASLVEGKSWLPTTSYYMLSEEENDDIVEQSEIPDGYEKKYGPPEEAGHVYTFDWDEIFDKPGEYRDLIRSISFDGFPLMLEYRDIQRLYNNLLKSITHSEDADLFEILD